MQQVDHNFSPCCDSAHGLIDVMEMPCPSMSTVDSASQESDNVQPVEMELTSNINPTSTSPQQVIICPEVRFDVILLSTPR